jgi:hypothetical protein
MFVGQGSLIIGVADDKHRELGIVLEQVGPGDPSRQEDPFWACQSRPLERSSPLAFQETIISRGNRINFGRVRSPLAGVAHAQETDV